MDSIQVLVSCNYNLVERYLFVLSILSDVKIKNVHYVFELLVCSNSLDVVVKNIYWKTSKAVVAASITY